MKGIKCEDLKERYSVLGDKTEERSQKINEEDGRK